MTLPPERAARGVPDAWRGELTGAERSLRRVVAAEWQLAATFFAASAPTWTGGEFFKPQDFANKHAATLRAIAAELDAPYASLPAAVERVRTLEPYDGPGLRELLYNFIDDQLRATGAGYHVYAAKAARLADAEGLRRLTLLAAMLRERGVPAAGVPSALQTAGLRDPYTGAPFGWEAGSASLVFVGLEPGERGRHRLPY
ncbi:MAG TPA: hypothetical protein VF322_03165 [Gammaproteobacteria bacterium]